MTGRLFAALVAARMTTAASAEAQYDCLGPIEIVFIGLLLSRATHGRREQRASLCLDVAPPLLSADRSGSETSNLDLAKACKYR